jgi:polyhydroxyalkanoate synthesis regulator phasin
MQDAWRAYLELALGATETSRKKAEKVARKLVGKSGATAAQLTAMAEEMVTTSAANRAALTKLVRFEVDKALGRVGLATADEVGELNTRLRDLEVELRAERARADAAEKATEPAATPVVAKRAPAKKAAPVSAAAAPAKKTAPAKQTAPAKKAVAKKTAVKKTTPPSAASIAEDLGSAEPIATPAKKTAAAPRKVVKKAPPKKAGGTA